MFSCVLHVQTKTRHARCKLSHSNARQIQEQKLGKPFESQRSKFSGGLGKKKDYYRFLRYVCMVDFSWKTSTSQPSLATHIPSQPPTASQTCERNMEVSACAQPSLPSPQMRCSSSSGMPSASRSLGQAPDSTCCHAAAGIWSHS